MKRYRKQASNCSAGCESLDHVGQRCVREDVRVVSQKHRLVFDEAANLGANTFQIFSSSPRQWKASVLSGPGILLLNRAREKHDLHPLVIHDNYLINLASAHDHIRQKSIEAFRGELERAIAIGAEYLVEIEVDAVVQDKK